MARGAGVEILLGVKKKGRPYKDTVENQRRATLRRYLDGEILRKRFTWGIHLLRVGGLWG